MKNSHSAAGPQVTVRTRQESVRRGESVILRCEAEGDAPLDLSWRVRDSKIDPNYDVRFVSKLIMRVSRAKAHRPERQTHARADVRAAFRRHRYFRALIREGFGRIASRSSALITESHLTIVTRIANCWPTLDTLSYLERQIVSPPRTM